MVSSTGNHHPGRQWAPTLELGLVGFGVRVRVSVRIRVKVEGCCLVALLLVMRRRACPSHLNTSTHRFSIRATSGRLRRLAWAIESGTKASRVKFMVRLEIGLG
jgi:hypothetical protein